MESGLVVCGFLFIPRTNSKEFRVEDSQTPNPEPAILASGLESGLEFRVWDSQTLTLQPYNIGTLIRLGFWGFGGPLYYIHKKGPPPQKSIGN